MNDAVSPPDSLLTNRLEFLLTASPQELHAFLASDLTDGAALLDALKDRVIDYLNIDGALAYTAGERAFELAEQLGEAESRALGHWCRAMGLTGQGDFQAALGFFDRSRALYTEAGQPVEAWRVARRQLQALATVGDLEAAQSLAQEVRAGLRAHGLLDEAANVENNLGIIQARLGNYNEAINTLKQARATHEAVGDRGGVARADLNLGDAYQHIDRFGEALEHLESAVGLFEELGHTYLLAGTLINLAMLYRREGRLSLVLDMLARAKTLFAQLENSADVALAQLEEARVRLEMNMLDEAETLARMLSQTFAERDMHIEQLEAQTLLGMTLAKAAAFEEASFELQQAREGWLLVGNDLQAAWVEVYLVNLLVAQAQQGASKVVARAQELLSLAQTVFNTQASRVGQAITLTLQAQLHYLQANYDDAQAVLPQAERLGLELGIPDLIIRTARLSGLIAVKQSNYSAAEMYFKRAIEALESVRASLNIDDFKTAYFGEKLDVYSDMIELLLTQERFDLAYHYVERSKSRALLDLLGQGLALTDTTDSPEVISLQAELGKARAELNWHYLRVEQEGNSGEHWAKVQEAEGRVTTLIRELERLVPRAAAALPLDVPELDTITASLDDATVVLEYYALGDKLLAFIVTQGGISCTQTLGTLSEIKQHINRLSFTMLRVAQGDVYEQVYGKEMLLMRTNGALKSLYDILIKPLGLSLKGKKLIVIPYAGLHAVPFSGLFNGKQYLFEETLVSLAPSTAVYLHCATKVVTKAGKLVAFGVPFKDIPAVRDEVMAVTGTFENSSALMGTNATLEAFNSHAPAASVLHIATHGIYRPDNPMFSGLRFSDGWLAARDLYALKLNASLVVLSACETGVSSSSHSDELFGLARGFFHAGTPCMVVSLWAVKDTPTSELMVAFYQGLSAGLGAAEALRDAQKIVKERYPNPYFWSAFNVLGDPGRKVI